MTIYNVILSGQKPSDVQVFSYMDKEKAFESARRLILYHNDGSMEKMIYELRKSGKAFGTKGKKTFCILLTTGVVQ